MQRKWRKKGRKATKNMSAAVVTALLLTVCGGHQLYAEEHKYFVGKELADDTTTKWDKDTSTAILYADRTIGHDYMEAYSHFGKEFVSLVSNFSPYSVTGESGNETLTLEGDIVSPWGGAE